MVKLTIDNKEVCVAPGTTILQAAETLGIRIPRFCYHKRLSIAGNCRMCLVEVEGQANPVISCKEAVREGMVVRTNSEMVLAARADVLEFILLNHPVDCPICDQSGECDLQDTYFEHSLRPSRLVGEKVHKPKAQCVGPHIVLDAERCLECTRCIRFCEEVVGVHEIGLYDRGDHSTIGVLPGRELANPYSLCTVDLCPVGALTSVDFRFKKRVWFLSSAPSVCMGCATGCNVWVDFEDGIVYRYRPRENEEVNKSWLCDAGRMTYKAVLAKNRILSPQVKSAGKFAPSSWNNSIAQVKGFIRTNPNEGISVILSAESSIEDNVAIAELGRNLSDKVEIFWSGRDPDPAFADEILRDANRNPNTIGVQMIASKQLINIPRGQGVIVLDGLEQNEISNLIASRPAWVVLITSTLSALGTWADIVLPRSTHVETTGLYVNRTKRLQRVMPAFEPLADALPVWEIANRIAGALGLKWNLLDARSCRNRAKELCTRFSSIDLESVPLEGIAL